MNLSYDPPRTLRRFMRSGSFGRIAAGPIGSGKTTACVLELFRRACEQKPGKAGIRRTRFAVVRQTLKQLKDTVLKDCQSWLSPVGTWKVSDGTFYVEFNDVKSEWVFIPLEDAADQARLLSMQLTGAWLSECIEMNLDVVSPISGRLGRFPNSEQDGLATWNGIVADTNMPTEMSAWHTFMENLPSEWEKFVQPSGLDQSVDAQGNWIGAENLNYLNQTEATRSLPFDHPVRLAQGRRYYERLVEMYGENSAWVTRYVKAQYGNDPSGQAVFRATFKKDFHVVPRINLVPGYPLLIAQDFGRNPWSLICQPDHMGRLLVHKEVPAINVGLEKHLRESLRPALFHDQFQGYRILVVGDPAGVAKDTISEESCIDVLKRHGFPAFPAPTNDIEPRLRAVERCLGQQVNGGPMLVISEEGCPWLVRAMNGGYRFTRTKLGALRVVPEKNDAEDFGTGEKVSFSHVADDLQYACLVFNAGIIGEIQARLYPRPLPPSPQISARGWT